MNRRDLPHVIDAATAAQVVATIVPWEPSVRTMQRWANRGIAGGFRSRTTGRALFRTNLLLRAGRP